MTLLHLAPEKMTPANFDVEAGGSNHPAASNTDPSRTGHHWSLERSRRILLGTAGSIALLALLTVVAVLSGTISPESAAVDTKSSLTNAFNVEENNKGPLPAFNVPVSLSFKPLATPSHSGLSKASSKPRVVVGRTVQGAVPSTRSYRVGSVVARRSKEEEADGVPADDKEVATEAKADEESAAAKSDEKTLTTADEEPAADAAKTDKAPASKGKKGKIPLADLVVGAEVTGKIRSVKQFGAFVDIGTTTDGLLHVSEISNDFVEDATEKLKAGETVTCKIKEVNVEKKQFALTMRPPKQKAAPKADLSEYANADKKEFVTGKVVKIADFGAFVTIKEGVDGLVHISQIQEGRVDNVEDVLKVGQEVQVRIKEIDVKKRRIALSMLPWSEEDENEEAMQVGGQSFVDEPYEGPNAFEVAWKKAQEREKVA